MKKNVLFFTKTMGIGGTEKVVIQMCENLRDEFNKIIVCSCGGIHEEKLLQLGIMHYNIKDIENKNILTIIKNIKTIINIVKEEKIDIIHTHHRMALFYANIISKFKKCTIVHTAHNTFKDKKILTKLIMKNNNIIAVGEKVRDNIVDYYKVKKSNVTVIYNGIDEKFQYNKIEFIKELKDKGYFLVGNIGRLTEQKGIEYFLKAIPILVAKNIDIKFLVIGEGEKRKQLEDLVKSLNISEHVIFMGYRDDVQNIISQIDLVVLSSLWEGLPLTPIEAFSVGKTIIATNVDGTQEIVKHKKNGILIRPRDIDSIAHYISIIYNNKSLYDSLNLNAYKSYKEKFSIDKFRDNYIEYYNNLI